MRLNIYFNSNTSNALMRYFKRFFIRPISQ